MSHCDMTIHTRLKASGRALGDLRVWSTDTVAQICKQLRQMLQSEGEAEPVVKFVFNGEVLKEIGRDSQHHHVTLAEWNITDHSVIDIILLKPPPTCARCDPSGCKVDEDGDISHGDFPDMRLECCGRRLCRECFQQVHGKRCPLCDCSGSSVTARPTDGTRSNWGGPALPSSGRTEQARQSIAAEGSASDSAYSSTPIPEQSSQILDNANDRWLVLLDLNGVLLYRPRQGASVEGAKCIVTEFPEGGYNQKPYRIYHRRGVSELLDYLVHAPCLEWGFCTNQMASNALQCIRALLTESLQVEVHERKEARLALKGGSVDQQIWFFDQGYCMDDPRGEVYPTTGQPVQVFDIKTKVLGKCGHSPERTLVIASSGSKCSHCKEMWVGCTSFDEVAVCNADEGGINDLLERLVARLGS